MRYGWTRLANWIVRSAGSLAAFTAVLAAVVVWLALGPAFGFSEGWLLFAGTATSVVTFVLVFVIQYSQNRDTRTIQLKLDELIRALADTRNELMRLEHKSDEELDAVEQDLRRVHDERGVPTRGGPRRAHPR